MEHIREYLMGVIAAALLCGVIMSVFGKKGMVGVAIKLMGGLFMILAVVHPWLSISLEDWFDWNGDIVADGEEYVISGAAMANNAYRVGIKEQLEAYIVDEAKALECTISVEVTLTDDQLPGPKSVILTGNISPYARQVLSNILTKDLGIEQEDQIWNVS